MENTLVKNKNFRFHDHKDETKLRGFVSLKEAKNNLL